METSVPVGELSRRHLLTRVGHQKHLAYVKIQVAEIVSKVLVISKKKRFLDVYQMVKVTPSNN